MKKGLLFLMLSVLTLGAWAQTTSPYTGVAVSDIVSGNDYYLYNVESGLWLQNNDRKSIDWSTRAQLGSRGLDFQLNAVEGGYKINAKFGRGSINRDDYYLDNNDDHVWVFEAKSNSVSNAVTIKSDSKYLTADSYQAGFPYNNMYKVGEPQTAQWYLNNPGNSTNGTWQIVTRAERIAKMVADGATQAVDASWLIKSPDFANNDTRYNSWTKTGNWGRGGDANGDYGRGSMVVESWNSGSNVEICQTIADIPNGIYEVTFQGFYRDGKVEDIGGKYAEGTEEIRAKYFANHVEADFRSIIYPDHTSASTGPDRWPKQTGSYYVPNSMADCSRCMNLENVYHNTPIQVTVTDGILKIGAKKTGSVANDWVIIDNFKLTYRGLASDGNYTGSGHYSYLFDGDTNTKWECYPNWGSGGHWGFNKDNGNVLFETSEPVYVNGLTLYTGADTKTYPNRNPYEWYLYGTNDSSIASDKSENTIALENETLTDSGWTLIGYVNNAQMPAENAVGKYYKFNPSQTAYKYFRFYVRRLVGEDELQLSELVLDYSLTPKAPITEIANSGGKPESGEIAKNIFDGLSTTKWYHYSKNNWVVFKTANPIYASSYIIQTANDAEGRDPKTFKLYGALGDDAPTTDGTTTGWTEIDSEDDASGTIPTDRYSFAEFTIDEPGIYQYFMLKVEDTRSANDFQISEFIIDNDPAYAIITSDADMAEFARKVNEDGKTSLNAFLLADVNSSTPIGNDNKMYTGIIDGMGHKVNLNIDASVNQQAFVSVATDGATIQNLVLTGEVKSTGNKTGGFIAEAKVGGIITIINCGNEAKITGAGGETAAIVANNWGYRCTLNISNVYNIGDVSGTGDVASICACQGNGSSTFTNVYNAGKVTGDAAGKFVRNSPGTYTNCYSTSLTSYDNSSIISTDAEKVASGELCYKLGAAFTQDLSPKGHPTFGSKTVSAGQWFNDADNDVYYNEENGNYTVYQLNLDETKTAYNVPVNVTAKNVTMARNLKAEVWNTFCSPVAIAKSNFSAAKELTGVTVNGDNYSMTFADVDADVLEAGKPYMVQVSEGKSSLTASNVPVVAAGTSTRSETFNGLTFNGNFTNGNAPQGSFIISNNVFYNVDSTVALKAFRGYITVAGAGVKALNFDFEDDATSINEELRMKNEESAIYNLAGQRLNKAQKGINIINGKKILK